MNRIIALLTLCFAMPASANQIYPHINVDLSREISETGMQGSVAYKRFYDTDRFGLGLGVSYFLRSPKEADNTWSFALLYELPREVSQATTIATAGSSVTQTNLPKIQMTTLSATNVEKLTEDLQLLGGVDYIMPAVDQPVGSTWDMDPGFGLHVGVAFQKKRYRSEITFQTSRLPTSTDDGFDGEADIQSVNLTTGYMF